MFKFKVHCHNRGEPLPHLLLNFELQHFNFEL